MPMKVCVFVCVRVCACVCVWGGGGSIARTSALSNNAEWLCPVQYVRPVRSRVVLEDLAQYRGTLVIETLL